VDKRRHGYGIAQDEPPSEIFHVKKTVGIAGEEPSVVKREIDGAPKERNSHKLYRDLTE